MRITAAVMKPSRATLYLETGEERFRALQQPAASLVFQLNEFADTLKPISMGYGRLGGAHESNSLLTRDCVSGLTKQFTLCVEVT